MEYACITNMNAKQGVDICFAKKRLLLFFYYGGIDLRACGIDHAYFHLFRR
jgi:hypothetical protein